MIMKDARSGFGAATRAALLELPDFVVVVGPVVVVGLIVGVVIIGDVDVGGVRLPPSDTPSCAQAIWYSG
jgi:hypothetical protein